jgi:small subunit ribosomal protein S11
MAEDATQNEEQREVAAQTAPAAEDSQGSSSETRKEKPPAQDAGAGQAAGAGAAGADEESKPIPSKSRSRGGKFVPTGIVFILATFNNTLVSITDARGNVVSWSSAGRCGFKGSRKSTAYAATMVAQEAARAAAAQGMREVEVRVQGPGAGRESAIRAVQAVGMQVTSIKDTTPIPHNGCRPPKRRRV